MHSLLIVALFAFFSIFLHNTVAETFDVQSNVKDRTDLDIFCTQYQEDSIPSRACHCGMRRTQSDTCCFDLPYAVVPEFKPKPSCRYVHKSGYYFLVDQCPSTDSVWSDLCNSELSEVDYVQKLVPVTSLLTNITYKNYYCYKCNEASDEFLFWTLDVYSEHKLPTISEHGSEELAGKISFIYKKTSDNIMASYDDEIGYFSMKSSIKFPDKIKSVTHICEPDVISTCSDKWSGEEIRNKCLSYLYLNKVVARDETNIKYKNIHCALCNYENLKDVYCRKVIPYRDGSWHTTIWNWEHYGGGYGGGHGVGSSKLLFDRNAAYDIRRGYFSYIYLLDINTSDGELVGKFVERADNCIWDPFYKKWRELKCALPGFIVKNGKCVKE